MAYPDSYFSFQKPRSDSPSRNESTSLSPGSTPQSGFTPFLLDSLILSPGSIQKPHYAVLKLDLETSTSENTNTDKMPRRLRERLGLTKGYKEISEQSTSNTIGQSNSGEDGGKNDEEKKSSLSANVPSTEGQALGSQPVPAENSEKEPFHSSHPSEELEFLTQPAGALSTPSSRQPTQPGLDGNRPLFNVRTSSLPHYRATLGLYAPEEQQPQQSGPPTRETQQTNVVAPQPRIGLFHRVQRRLGISEGSRSSTTMASPPGSPPQQKRSTHNVHAPVYDTRVLLEAEREKEMKKKKSDEEGKEKESKPRGRARLQSFFKRHAKRDHAPTRPLAAPLGLSVDEQGRSLSFLPGEARKVMTPPPSEEPRLPPSQLSPGSLRSRIFEPRGKNPFADPTDNDYEDDEDENANGKDKDGEVMIEEFPDSPIPKRGRSRLASPATATLSTAPPIPPPAYRDMFRNTWAYGSSATEDIAGGSSGSSSRHLASVNVDSIPEHLPSSPMCPRNPKHKSGGKGECPYHGKNEPEPQPEVKPEAEAADEDMDGKDDGDNGEGDKKGKAKADI